jgi:protein-S-isoprenylcysteine O-methyltransferase Ste14
MAGKRDTAGVIAYPPLIYGIPLVTSLVADRILSKKRLPPAFQALSIGFFAAAAIAIAPAATEFRNADTPVDPYEETTALIESGPYAYSRNPLYLGLTFLYIGTSLAFRARLPLAVLPAVLWVMNAGVIEREERYLERKFGDAYRDYMQRVPRWM